VIGSAAAAGDRIAPERRESKVMRILIVEDNLDFRVALKESLAARFPELTFLEAADGEEALRVAEQHRPALVFMDVGLPGENGLTITRKLKGKHPETRVVVLTNYDQPEYEEEAYSSGADDFLCKQSTDWDQLVELVRSVMVLQSSDL
jgi:DNA-binding NarL/FixJ family response regulator